MVPGCLCGRTRREGPSGLSVSAQSRRSGATCPECQQRSTIIHGHYHRRPLDLPLIGRHVRLDLRVRRYACQNANCRRQTFGERLPMLIAPSAQRTKRLAKAQARIGVALGGAAGSRLAAKIAMPVSGDTVLRLIRQMPQPVLPPATVIGIDDWAMKKRLRYGTIIVDLERHCPIDLLPDRTAGTVTDWLRQRPEIEIVARVARPNTVVGSRRALRTPSRSPIVGIFSPTRGKWSSDGLQALMRGFGVCRRSRA
nr:ISL3 family transposase [Aurantimonas sp. 22II-16-19i]